MASSTPSSPPRPPRPRPSRPSPTRSRRWSPRSTSPRSTSRPPSSRSTRLRSTSPPRPPEDPQELRLQREQAAALGWSTGQAEFVIAAAAGRLYLHQFGSLYCRDIPGTAGRLVSNHRMSALVKAGFVTVSPADANRERPVLVTVDGRRAVAVWKRWKPRPVE
ncbi:hypothetical protein [Streptomyces mirabilis]|uniref:hypothetical protein n=1 Tax=Streptomyces mirabilis TaxID=68239 RepID=UPI0036F16A69